MGERRVQRLTGRAWAPLEGALRAYAGVFFSSNRLSGLLFAVATFAVVPRQGLLGLLGLLTTEGAARLLGVDPDGRGRGLYALNGLLVGLALGWYFEFGWPVLGLLLLAALLGVAVTAAARSLAEGIFGVPVLSLPFVFVTWAALLAAARFSLVRPALDPIVAAQLGQTWLPALPALYVKSLGAALYQLSLPAGLLVLAGLLLASRWATVLSLVGFASGLLTYRALGGIDSDLTGEVIGFNFVLAAIAVGGFYVTLSPASLLLAAAAGALSAGASAALLTALTPLKLPALALPFIVTTHAVLYALGRRARAGRLALVGGVPGALEENLERTLGLRDRYPDPALPLLRLPVLGPWWVSQGHDGPHTHQGPWRHAWDLEVRDGEGRLCRGEGAEPVDYHCFGLPVLAPGDGTVVHGVGHLPDQPVGQPDLAHNWGNCLVIWHGGAVWSLLGHLRQGSLLVGVGERVQAGQVLARVGSSGRAPRPHLHLQLQSGPLPGAPTLPAELLHYLEIDSLGGRLPRYRTSGVPTEGQTVVGLQVDELRREALALPQGHRWAWTGTHAGRPVRERWEAEIDLLGARSLVGAPRGDRIELHAERAYTTAVRYRGRGGTLLHLFALACPRVPHTATELVWEDRLLAGPLLRGVPRLLYELALPFGQLIQLQTRSRIVPDPEELIVETTLALTGPLARLAQPLPDRIRVRFTPADGPVHLVATREGRPWAEASSSR